jgi:four helix bundle protein
VTASSPFRFAHETLDCYRLAVEVARTSAGLALPPGRAPLRDQLLRATDSVVLNIAEGRTRGGPTGRNHYRIAAGSAAEACAALDLVGGEIAAAAQDKLRRVGVMVQQLARR